MPEGDVEVRARVSIDGDSSSARRYGELIGDGMKSFFSRIGFGSVVSGVEKGGRILEKSAKGAAGTAEAAATGGGGVSGFLLAAAAISSGVGILNMIADSVRDFPVVVAIMKILKLIMFILLIPLIPVLKPLLQYLAEVAKQTYNLMKEEGWMAALLYSLTSMAKLFLAGIAVVFAAAILPLFNVFSTSFNLVSGISDIIGKVWGWLSAFWEKLKVNIIQIWNAIVPKSWRVQVENQTTPVPVFDVSTKGGVSKSLSSNKMTWNAEQIMRDQRIQSSLFGGSYFPVVDSSHYGQESKAFNTSITGGLTRSDIRTLVDRMSIWKTTINMSHLTSAVGAIKSQFGVTFTDMLNWKRLDPWDNVNNRSLLPLSSFLSFLKMLFNTAEPNSWAKMQIGGIIPKDMPIMAHRGERVISATENFKGRQEVVINLSVNGPVVREEFDIQRLVREISRQLQVSLRGYVSYAGA
jgi:hypothetical protein